MKIQNMTRKDFDKVAYRKSWNESVRCDSLVILPLCRRHDSGYRAMDFVAVLNDEPLCRLSGCSDVVHIEGIGGFGKDWLKVYGTCPKLVPSRAWSIDCLPKSGLLRIFVFGHSIICGAALSSFEVYSEENKA